MQNTIEAIFELAKAELLSGRFRRVWEDNEGVHLSHITGVFTLTGSIDMPSGGPVWFIDGHGFGGKLICPSRMNAEFDKAVEATVCKMQQERVSGIYEMIKRMTERM